ncbi:hypothetical protein HN709_00195 [Candidatus Peregrinibacteria bacterium]|jgi:hypothetical protein|nr:hypothetical protein [Candidatus Peregrinibacteria bacterium]MBT7736092.1 hypothetical protein [Candidatus Peregrinibacteria bacterium]
MTEIAEPKTTKNQEIIENKFQNLSAEILEALRTIFEIQKLVNAACLKSAVLDMESDQFGDTESSAHSFNGIRAGEIAQNRFGDRTQNLNAEITKAGTPQVHLRTEHSKGSIRRIGSDYNDETITITPEDYVVTRTAIRKSLAGIIQNMIAIRSPQLSHDKTIAAETVYSDPEINNETEKKFSRRTPGSKHTLRKEPGRIINGWEISVDTLQGRNLMSLLKDFHENLVQAAEGNLVTIPENLKTL